MLEASEAARFVEQIPPLLLGGFDVVEDFHLHVAVENGVAGIADDVQAVVGQGAGDLVFAAGGGAKRRLLLLERALERGERGERGIAFLQGGVALARALGEGLPVAGECGLELGHGVAAALEEGDAVHAERLQGEVEFGGGFVADPEQDFAFVLEKRALPVLRAAEFIELGERPGALLREAFALPRAKLQLLAEGLSLAGQLGEGFLALAGQGVAFLGEKFGLLLPRQAVVIEERAGFRTFAGERVLLAACRLQLLPVGAVEGVEVGAQFIARGGECGTFGGELGHVLVVRAAKGGGGGEMVLVLARQLIALGGELDEGRGAFLALFGKLRGAFVALAAGVVAFTRECVEGAASAFAQSRELGGHLVALSGHVVALLAEQGGFRAEMFALGGGGLEIAAALAARGGELGGEGLAGPDQVVALAANVGGFPGVVFAKLGERRREPLLLGDGELLPVGDRLQLLRVLLLRLGELRGEGLAFAEGRLAGAGERGSFGAVLVARLREIRGQLIPFRGEGVALGLQRLEALAVVLAGLGELRGEMGALALQHLAGPPVLLRGLRELRGNAVPFRERLVALAGEDRDVLGKLRTLALQRGGEGVALAGEGVDFPAQVRDQLGASLLFEIEIGGQMVAPFDRHVALVGHEGDFARAGLGRIREPRLHLAQLPGQAVALADQGVDFPLGPFPQAEGVLQFRREGFNGHFPAAVRRGVPRRGLWEDGGRRRHRDVRSRFHQAARPSPAGVFAVVRGALINPVSAPRYAGRWIMQKRIAPRRGGGK